LLGAADGCYGRAGGAMAALAALVAASQLCTHAAALRPLRGVLGERDAGSGRAMQMLLAVSSNCCQPRHPTQFDPLPLDSTGIM